MAIQKNEIKFKDGFNGKLFAEKGSVAVGTADGALLPYDLLFGALATCLYSTFVDVAKKKKITYDSANVIVTGEKRKEIPATLSWVNVVLEVKNASEEKGILRSAELAIKYCSVYETISKVADMNLEVKFI